MLAGEQEVKIVRYLSNDYATFGKLLLPIHNEVYFFETLELPWRRNQRDISCIPAGKYYCERAYYNKGGYEVFEITQVPNRGDIYIHIGNYPKNSLGCILIGTYATNSTMIDLSNSAYRKFMGLLKDTQHFKIEIIDGFNSKETHC